MKCMEDAHKVAQLPAGWELCSDRPAEAYAVFTVIIVVVWLWSRWSQKRHLRMHRTRHGRVRMSTPGRAFGNFLGYIGLGLGLIWFILST